MVKLSTHFGKKKVRKKMSSEKINLIRKIRVELDNITIDCFDKKYPSYISNSLCTVLNMLDRTCIDLYEHKKRGDK